KEELYKGPRLSRTGYAGEAARVPRLADQIYVRESPGDQSEGSSEGEQFVRGHPVIPKHVGDQTAGGVEIQRGLQQRRPNQQVRIDNQCGEKRQEERGNGNHTCATCARRAAATAH